MARTAKTHIGPANKQVPRMKGAPKIVKKVGAPVRRAKKGK